MILSVLNFKNRLVADVFIEPYTESQLNPNSYNLKLHHEFLVYDTAILDMKIKKQSYLACYIRAGFST